MYITLYYIHCAQADLVWAACCVALLALKCEGRLAPGGVGWKAEGETDKILTYHDFEGKTHTQSSPVIYHDVSLKVAIWMQTLRSLRLTLLAEAPHTPPVYWNLELGSIGKLQIRDIQGGSKPGNSDLLSLFSVGFTQCHVYHPPVSIFIRVRFQPSPVMVGLSIGFPTLSSW